MFCVRTPVAASYFFEAMLIIAQVNKAGEILSKNINSIFDKKREKLLTECYYVILENFKSCHENCSSQT